jgi:hypothetical protein
LFVRRFQRSARSRKDHEKITAIFEAASDHETEPGDSDHDSGEVEGDVVQLEVDELEQDEELRLHVLGLNSYWSAAIETNFGTNLKNLPARWLAPGTIRMLWMQMCQEAKGVSYKHFWTVFRQNWHQILRFLPSSSHGACDTCVAFKSGFRKALHPQEKFHNAKAYKAHIDSVCQDRDLEAFLQVSNPLANAGSALCLHFVSCLDLVCANDLASFSVKATIVHTKLLCHCGKPKAALMSLKAHQAPYTFLSHAPIYQ